MVFLPCKPFAPAGHDRADTDPPQPMIGQAPADRGVGQILIGNAISSRHPPQLRIRAETHGFPHLWKDNIKFVDVVNTILSVDLIYGYVFLVIEFEFLEEIRSISCKERPILF
jgi:hypothetical protein